VNDLQRFDVGLPIQHFYGMVFKIGSFNALVSSAVLIAWYVGHNTGLNKRTSAVCMNFISIWLALQHGRHRRPAIWRQVGDDRRGERHTAFVAFSPHLKHQWLLLQKPVFKDGFEKFLPFYHTYWLPGELMGGSWRMIKPLPVDLVAE
jgi:hypothetical protein